MIINCFANEQATILWQIFFIQGSLHEPTEDVSMATVRLQTIGETDKFQVQDTINGLVIFI